jgi:hypothetical protein
MALSTATIRDLRKEIIELERSRKTIDASILGIKAVLGANTDGQSGAVAQATSPAGSLKGKNSAAVGGGRRRRRRNSLYRSVASVLDGMAGLRPREITQRLKDAGVTVSGKTPLSHRVHLELSRMMGRGLLERTADGNYRLTELTAKVSQHPQREATPSSTPI